MSGSKTVKIAISTLVLGLAFSAMLYSSLSEDTQYYKHVNEVMTQPANWYGKRLQLHGHASDIRRKPDSLDYRFDVAYGGQVVRANYTGIVPDTFKDGSEVVVKGTLGPEGFVVEPNGVMAKCPSKYEAGSPGNPGGASHPAGVKQTSAAN
ncbi:cytochrome C biogenesis protein CcmE [Luteitalea sp. TBR-22]|uniref:cytochrome c maturation protein CcmE n=1 Tax=Luteitalea sp. TBR-22 TaxID=2802971 RepID=UPI001AF9B388|nr:cytochrome c maturation protein CcmE [Luteitalea sp. TBR-22]BCS33252.1 cytochrome C biogenesis protein CcmE [Luteitalea sp. TBR-22]